LEALPGGLAGDQQASLAGQCLLALANVTTVNWIASANDLKPIPSALVSRFSVIEVPAPPADAFGGALRQVLSDIAADYEVPEDGLPELEPELVAALRAGFAVASGLREGTDLAAPAARPGRERARQSPAAAAAELGGRVQPDRAATAQAEPGMRPSPATIHAGHRWAIAASGHVACPDGAIAQAVTVDLASS
jgi:hypothetical protein